MQTIHSSCMGKQTGNFYKQKKQKQKYVAEMNFNKSESWKPHQF
jgi:hypothetical protein